VIILPLQLRAMPPELLAAPALAAEIPTFTALRTLADMRGVNRGASDAAPALNLKRSEHVCDTDDHAKRS